jgi:hypothetical protein
MEKKLIDLQMDITFAVFDGRLIDFGCQVLHVVVHWRVATSLKFSINIFWSDLI